jgi:hypothetical protein
MSPIARLDTLANEPKRAFELVTASYFAHLGTLGRNSDTLGGNTTDVRPLASLVGARVAATKPTCGNFSGREGTQTRREGNTEATMRRPQTNTETARTPGNAGAAGAERSH